MDGEPQHAMMVDRPIGRRGANPLVSVIVPVRDNPDGLRALLRGLAAQTLDPDGFEVVIGDDGTQPGLLTNVESADGRVRVLTGPPRTSYAARNRAAGAARGEVLAFCDSDCLPDSRWLEEGLAALEGADLVAGEVTFLAPARPTVWSLLTIDMFQDQERNVVRSRAVTANLIVRRRDFEEWGRFDPSLASGGDYEFALRAVARGARLVYAPRAVVYHPTLDGPRAFLRKVWKTNRWGAVRRVRGGFRVQLRSATAFIPVLGVLLDRRRARRSPWRLQQSRLRASGLTVRWWDEVRALAVLYALVGYASSLARLCGWLEARSEGRREDRAPRPQGSSTEAGRGAGST